MKYFLCLVLLFVVPVEAAEPVASLPVEIVPKGDVTGEVIAIEEVKSTESVYLVKLDASDWNDPATRVFVIQDESVDNGKTWQFVCATAFPGGAGLTTRIISCKTATKENRQVRTTISVQMDSGKKRPDGFPEESKKAATINLSASVVKK